MRAPARTRSTLERPDAAYIALRRTVHVNHTPSRDEIRDHTGRYGIFECVPSSAHGALAVAADDSLGARTVLAVVCVSIVAYALVIWRSPSFKDPRVTLSRQRNASDLHALVCVVGVSCWVARHGSVGMLTDPNILLHDRIQGLHWLQVGAGAREEPRGAECRRF